MISPPFRPFDATDPVSPGSRRAFPAGTAGDLPPLLERGLTEYISSFDPPLPGSSGRASLRPCGDAERTVADIFDILTHRRFSHLSRARAEPYRQSVTTHLLEEVRRGRPVRFYYDLGPGYHASIDLSELKLSFDVGLGEILALHQIVTFSREVQRLYPPGARFWLVIDNLCGRATNDVPLKETSGYVAQLRRLIDELELSHRVSVLAESELNSWETYRTRLERESRESPPDVGPKDIRNVMRFLGRPCDASEAAARIELYRRTGCVTEELLAPAIAGVRLTQRATSSTLGFRAFSGADQRIQVGQVALTPWGEDELRPILITTHNSGRHDLQWFSPPDGMPSPIRRVLFATRRKNRKRPDVATQHPS